MSTSVCRYVHFAAVLCISAACATPSGQSNQSSGQVVQLPPNHKVSVQLTAEMSESNKFDQKTDITWPDGTFNTFIWEQGDANPYGQTSFNTDSKGGQATVTVFDRPAGRTGPWTPVATKQATTPTGAVVQSEGHPGSPDWNDTVVTFTW